MLPNVYKYLDYRQYFTDIYDERKETLNSFSYRAFSRLAGSSAPNFLQFIQARKLSISDKQLKTLSESLSLDEKQSEYLEAIVNFDHATTHEEKNSHFQKILITREYQNVKIIENRQYEYLSHWYNPVIRELLISPAYNQNPEWIAKRVVPAVSVSKIKKSILLLEELGLIKRDSSDEVWLASDSTISTPSEVISVAVVNYHKEMICLAGDSIERFKSDQRDVRAVTFKVPKEKQLIIKKRMESFWNEILAFSDENEDEQGTGDVMQMNMQFFPVAIMEQKTRGKNEK